MEVSGQGEAQQVLAAAQEAAQEIHGLGAGGNKAAAAPQAGQMFVMMRCLPCVANVNDPKFC